MALISSRLDRRGSAMISPARAMGPDFDRSENGERVV